MVTRRFTRENVVIHDSPSRMVTRRFTREKVILCRSLLQLADDVSRLQWGYVRFVWPIRVCQVKNYLEVLAVVGRGGYGDRGKDRCTRNGEESDEECCVHGKY